MAERSISYEFLGNFTNLRAGLASAGQSVKSFGAELTALDAKGAKMRSGLTTLGSTAGKIGLVGAVGLGLMVKAAADFDQAMSNVQAATHETADNMGLLRAAAIKAGADTVFSATEAAGAIEELAKAGVSTKDILAGGLTGSLNLAAAGGLAVADAAQIAASAMVQFKLSGSQVGHVADLLAAGAGKAQGSVQDLGYALKYAGVPANSLGISIEETTGVLAEFASAGIVGEQAGTTLRSMLLSLAAPTKQAQQVMDDYGLSLYDAQGNFVGLQGAAEQLQNKLGGLSEAERNHALSVIFGQTAIQGAIKLYEGGGEAVSKWTDKVNDSGYAAETAATRMDNLKGDLEQLGGSLQTALIGAGTGSQSPLRSMVQDLTKLVNAYNDLPGPVKNAAGALAGITAVLGGGFWFGAKVITGIVDTRKALTDLAGTAPRTATALSAVGRAAGVATALLLMSQAIDALEKHMDAALPTANELAGDLLDLSNGQIDSLSGQFGNLGSTIDTVSAASGGFVGTINELTGWADKLGAGGIAGLFFDSPSQAIGDQVDEIKRLDEALTSLATTGGASAARQAFRSLAADQGLSVAQQQKLRDLLPGYRDALAGEANQAKIAAGATGKLGDAAAGAAPKLSKSAQAIQANRQAAREAADSFFDLSSAFQAPTLSLDDLLKRMHQYADAAVHFGDNLKTALENGANPKALDYLVKKLGPAAGLALQHIADGGKAAADRLNASWKEMAQGHKVVTNAIAEVENRMDGLGRRNVRLQADLDWHPLSASANLAENALDVLDHKRPKPKAELAGNVLAETLTAGKAVDGLGRKRANPIAALIDHASSPLQHIIALVDSVDGRHAETTVTNTIITRRVYQETHSTGYGPQPADGTNADGGPIPDAPGPYRDMFPYLLAPREHVVSNRYGQADMFRPLLDRINEWRPGKGLADGSPRASVSGRTGVDFSPAMWAREMAQAGDSIVNFALVVGHSSTSLDKAYKNEIKAREHRLSELVKGYQDELDAQKEHLDALKQEREAIMQGAASIIGAGHDLLGTTRTPVIPAVGSTGEITWTDSPATFASFSSALDAQFGTASQLKHVLQVFKRKHLGSQLLTWLITNGADIATLEDFANQSASDLQALSQQFHQINQVTHGVGNLASGAAGVNAEIRALRADNAQTRAEIRETNKKLDALNKNSKDSSDTLKAMHAHDPERTGEAAGHAAAAVIRGAFSDGQRRRGNG